MANGSADKSALRWARFPGEKGLRGRAGASAQFFCGHCQSLANAKITNYSYDANGNVTSVTDPNILTTATQYDALNRPILVTDPLLKMVTATYTPDDNIASIKDPNNNTTGNTYKALANRQSSRALIPERPQ